jgi:hypothetical protein
LFDAMLVLVETVASVSALMAGGLLASEPRIFSLECLQHAFRLPAFQLDRRDLSLEGILHTRDRASNVIAIQM